MELLVKNVKSTVLYMLKLLKTYKQNPPLCDTELKEIRRTMSTKSYKLYKGTKQKFWS